MSYFIGCDFDGTVTVHDTLHLLVRHYAPEVWKPIERRLRAGEITLMQAIEEEFRHICVTREEAVALVLREAGVRAGFPEFVRWTEDNGHELVLFSSGFRVLIEPLLASVGLERLRVEAGDAEFSERGTVLSFPPAVADCSAMCGLCKRDAVAAHGPFLGRPVVHIGDGYSDLCAARSADIVFARADLARFLTREGVAYHPFEDFFEIIRALEARAALPTAAREADPAP
jgi:2-hydroxy-3-keto-5-methylthiopentenyl-1-phosphate phosphatase